MGVLLKQVLKSLCGVHQWAYAVFWKIGCNNPNLLIWEECHLEPEPVSSGNENPQLPLGDLEGYCSSDAHSLQFKVQIGDRVHLLVNRMMLDQQVNLVGQGIVGRAAFTGNHVWLIANCINRNIYPPEVLSEIQHQFSAGIQTIAVIPVSPQGVVQFGSSLPIMENVGFVNNVKSLMLQLGCVPGSLLSDNLVVKESTERFGIPVCLGLLGNSVQNSNLLLADSDCQQSISSLPSRIAQPSSSQISRFQNTLKSTASMFHAGTSPKSSGLNSKPEMIAMKLVDPFRDQLDNRFVGAEVIPSNRGTWMSQYNTSLNSRPISRCQFDANSSILTLLERHVLSEVGTQNLNPNRRNEVDTIPPGIVTSQGSSSISAREFNKKSAGVKLRSLDSSRVEEASLSSLVEQISGSGLLSGSSPYGFNEGNDNENDRVTNNKKIDGDLCEVLSILSSHQNNYISLDEHISGSVANCSEHKSGSRRTNIDSAEHVNSYTQPTSGDDLFDVVGVDFKNKLLSSNRNSLLADGLRANSHLSKDGSTLTNAHEASSEFLSVDKKLSESGLFSATGTDNLLDAVVSGAYSSGKQNSDDNASCKTALTKICVPPAVGNSPMHGQVYKSDQVQKECFDLVSGAYSSGKQNSDDNASCKTTLTKICGPPAVGSSPMHGIVHKSDQVQECFDLVSGAYSSGKQNSDDNVSCKTTLTKICGPPAVGSSPMRSLVHNSDQVQKECFDLPKSLEKSATVLSSPFRSGCSKDGAESGSSRTTSIYGSQLSSWIGYSMRCDSSISTAYAKKGGEMNKPNRKRSKPGENPRPRPKDRQMIQDRVKELREIVPNGAKCSIDALLERTIKHMLFMQSVTKHADKLKQTGDSKILSKDGGATWAFEVGSQSMVCPIIVEDLNPPRQMLVEILCEERGFFLEIADLIRRMGLTILKGVMEARNDKVWARFVVEANRDVTRMEVFMSLVRLLEQTMKGNTSSSAAA